MAPAELQLPSEPTRVENISTLLGKTGKASTLPERYVFPASIVGCISGGSSLSLPVIDLAGLGSGDRGAREEIVRQIGHAAAEWGFFQVVNHGFPKEAIDALDYQARTFFELPVEVKERVADPEHPPNGYEGRNERFKERVMWSEYFAQWYRPSPTVEALAEKIWPDGNAKFCDDVNEFCKCAERLGERLIGLLAESLGLEATEFSRYLSDPATYRSSLRLQKYPACPDPSRALGSVAHSDSGLITILKQDEVGGLQVLKDDTFVDVTPIPGALVVNVGDTVEVGNQVLTVRQLTRMSSMDCISCTSDPIQQRTLYYVAYISNAKPTVVHDKIYSYYFIYKPTKWVGAWTPLLFHPPSSSSPPPPSLPSSIPPPPLSVTYSCYICLQSPVILSDHPSHWF